MRIYVEFDKELEAAVVEHLDKLGIEIRWRAYNATCLAVTDGIADLFLSKWTGRPKTYDTLTLEEFFALKPKKPKEPKPEPLERLPPTFKVRHHGNVELLRRIVDKMCELGHELGDELISYINMYDFVAATFDLGIVLVNDLHSAPVITIDDLFAAKAEVVEELTMEEICERLGKTVKIKK